VSAAPAARRVERPAASERAPLARYALAALVLLALVHLYRKANGQTFYYDEWDFVLDRRSWGPAAFLEPHNEHLSAVPVLIYKLLMATVGIRAHDPYLVVLLLLHALCAVLVWEVVRHRVGDWLALCAAALVLFLGSAYFDIVWAFQIGFLGSVAAGLGVVLALQRRDRSGDVLACVLLLIAVGSSSLGIPILGGALLFLLLHPDRRARLWVWAIPLGLYLVWYVGYGKSATKRENLTDAPAYAIEMIAAGAGGVFNQGQDLGRVLAVLGAYLLISRVARAGRASLTLIAVTATGLAFWLLTGIARADIGEPNASRYIYPSAVVMLLIAAEAARGLRVTRAGLAIAALITAAAVLSGLGKFHDGTTDLKARSSAIRVALAAVEVTGNRMPAEFIPQGDHAPQLQVGPYRQAVADLDETPALTLDEIRRANPVDRAYFDSVVIAGVGAGLAEDGDRVVVGGTPPTAEPTQDGNVETDGACLSFTPAKVGGRLLFALPANGVRIESKGTLTTKVLLRRFADAPKEVGEVPGGTAKVLRMPGDKASEPWQAGVAVDEPVEICGL
jgi:hypothetical protein